MTVVLVPGLGLGAREWDGVRSRLDASVVLLPSLGRRAGRRTDLSVEAAAERLLAVIDPDAADLLLVGHSAGCAVAVEAAARCRSVTGLVLVGPSTDPRAATWPRLAARWLRTAVHERPGEIPVLVPQYLRTGFVSMARGMNTIRTFRTDLALARTGVPVTIVRGGNDRITPDDWCRHLADAAGGPGYVVTVPDAAHMVPITHPVAVVEAIVDLDRR